MCSIIKCSIVVTLIVQSIYSSEIKNSKLLYSEQEIGECLKMVLGFEMCHAFGVNRRKKTMMMMMFHVLKTDSALESDYKFSRNESTAYGSSFNGYNLTVNHQIIEDYC